MKKVFTFFLCCFVIVTVTACNAKEKDNIEPKTDINSPIKDKETETFNALVDNIISNIDTNQDLSDLKSDVTEIKDDIQSKVTNAKEENEKSQYDIEQIAIFMLEQAINDYEAARESGDNDKIQSAKSNIEMAKKIWSSTTEKEK